MPVQLSDRALCTIDDVKALLNLEPEATPEAQTPVDDLLTRIVNGVSETIHRVARREFKSALQPPAPAVRIFDVEPRHLYKRTIRIGDAQAPPTLVELRDPETGFLIQDATTWVRSLPHNRTEPWEPITRIRFLFNAALVPGQELRVTATWGFPSVPDDIFQWAMTAAAFLYARDVEKFSATFSNEQGRVVLPRELPDEVRRGVEGYQVVSV